MPLSEMTSEKSIQAEILLKLGGHPEIRVFRNTVGFGWQGQLVSSDRDRAVLLHPRKVTFGLTPGSADLVGWRGYTVQPDDVGRRLAVFTSVEVKRAVLAHTQTNQLVWLHAIRDFGGIAIIARSDHEALSGVLDWRPG